MCTSLPLWLPNSCFAYRQLAPLLLYCIRYEYYRMGVDVMNRTLVSVFGTIFVDCKGFAFQNYKADTRNLGSIEFVHGGVGRNVAENLSQLDIPTALVSTTDESAIGKEVVDRLQRLGISTTNVKYGQKGMGMWLAILTEAGELAGSISQMPDLSVMSGIVAEHGRSIVECSEHIVLELDLNEAIVKQVLQISKDLDKPVYGIPGNLDVVLHYPEILKGLACFICNNYEMDLLAKAEFSAASAEEKKSLLTHFVHAAGLQSMIVTLGAEGSLYYDARSKEIGFQQVFPVDVVDTSGAGDAFFSGAVAALVRGASLAEAAVCGTKVAGWTISSKESICSNLREKMKEDQTFKDMLAEKV